MDVHNHQGKFGENYIRALASAAGLVICTPDPDYDGIDLLLRWPGRVGAAASPGIDVQVKSWSTPRQSGGLWQYDGLNEQQFNKLAGADYTVPRYLFLVAVPRDTNSYVDVSAAGMLLRHQAYYLSLERETPIPDTTNKRRRRIHVPVGNILTARSLLQLLHTDLPTAAGML